MTALLKCDACGNLIDQEEGYATFHFRDGAVEYRHFLCSSPVGNQGGEAIKKVAQQISEENALSNWLNALERLAADQAREYAKSLRRKEGTE